MDTYDSVQASMISYNARSLVRFVLAWETEKPRLLGIKLPGRGAIVLGITTLLIGFLSAQALH